MPQTHYSATRGITVSHSCGHISNHRISLGSFTKQVKTPETEKLLEQFIEKESRQRAVNQCLDCGASESYDLSRAVLNDYFALVGLEAPEELTGSIRQKAWGESVRTEAVYQTISSTFRTFITPTLGVRMYRVMHLHKTESQQTNQGTELSKLVNVFRERLLEDPWLAPYENRNSLEFKALAPAIIALRHILKYFISMSREKTEAKYWGLWARYRRERFGSSGYYTPDPYIVMNALLCVSIVNSGKLLDYDEIMKDLFKYYTEADEQSVDSYMNSGETALNSIELLKVEKTLAQSTYNNSWPPF